MGHFPVCEEPKQQGEGSGASAARQSAELEGPWAAREAEREGEAQLGTGGHLEGELLQQGGEEDEELGPGQLLPWTSPFAWKSRKKSALCVERGLSLVLDSCCSSPGELHCARRWGLEGPVGPVGHEGG